MRKILLFSLLLIVVHTSIKSEELIVEMTTATIGNSISLYVSVAYPGTTLNVDFGDGTKVPYDNVSFYNYTSISGGVAGNTIKIYGEPTDLTHLICDFNSLTSLDVSNNTALIYLSCYYNDLTSLDVSNNMALTQLYCDDNNLTSLDLSKNAALIDLYCDRNNLTSLDVSNNTALVFLSCYYNDLTSLDVSNNIALEVLACGINNLATLDVSDNAALIYLYCDNNSLTSLKMGNVTGLSGFICSHNNLTFSSLPQEGLSSDDFFYVPQYDISINDTIQISTPVDLSAESDVNGNITTFVWKNESGNDLVENVDYTIVNGVTTFLQTQQEKVYCEMTNPLFPDLTLKTTLADVSDPTSVVDIHEDGTTIFSANKTIFIDTPKKGLLSVVDLSGRVVVQKNINSGETKIPVFKNGVYIVSLSKYGQKSSKKIVVR